MLKSKKYDTQKPAKVLFIDRDGTIICETPDERIGNFAELTFYPKALFYLSKIASEFDYELVMVSNQDGLGTELFNEKAFFEVQRFIIKTLQGEGIEFKEIVIDTTYARENAPTRKPGTALLEKYFSEAYDLKNSYVIGDRLNDMILAKNLGAKGLWLRNNDKLGAGEGLDSAESLQDHIALQTKNWQDIYDFLKGIQNI